MSRKSIKRNYVYNVAYQVLSILSPLITAPYISRILEPDGIGLASYVNSIASYFVLFSSMGLSIFGQREISYVQEDVKKRSIIFWETIFIQMITATIGIISYIIFLVNQSNKILYLVLLFNIFSVMVNITWFFQGIEEFEKIVLRNAFFKLLSILYIFIFVRTKQDLVWYMLGPALFDFVSSISLWGYIPKYIIKIQFSELNSLRHLKVIISLFIPTIAIQVYTVLDKTMIGLITKDVFENGYYEQALKISKTLLMIIVSLGTVMTPRIGYHYGKNELEVVNNYMYKGYRFVWFLGIPLCLGLMAVSNNFVHWFYGENYVKVSQLITVLSFLILAIGISNVTGIQYLVPTGRQNILTITVFVGAIVNVIMNVILIRFYQSMGAAISSVVAETVIALFQLYFVHREISIKEIIYSARKYVIAGLIMFLLLLVVDSFLVYSVFSSLLLVIIGIIVYTTCLLLLHDNFMLDNFKNVLKNLNFLNKR